MEFIRNTYHQRIQSALSHDVIVFLVGARQTGKTTLMRSLYKGGVISSRFVYLSLDGYLDRTFRDVEDFYTFLCSYSTHDHIDTILLDEIQDFPHIGILLKSLYDYLRVHEIQTKIICSGSGSLQIFQGISDSLVGRKEIVYVYSFSFEEFVEYKGIVGEPSSPALIDRRLLLWDEFVIWGGYPAVVTASSLEEKNRILEQLYQDYLMRDVTLFLKREEIVSFRKFFVLLATHTCSLLGVETFARELGLTRTIIQKFLFVLENTFIIHSVSPFHHHPHKEISSRVKTYFLDTGMLRKVLGIPHFVGDLQGKATETFVVTELLKYISSSHEIYFRQKKSQTEIDIVICDTISYRLMAIEVKHATTDVFPRAFLSFDELYHDRGVSYILCNRTYQSQRWSANKALSCQGWSYARLSQLLS